MPLVPVTECHLELLVRNMKPDHVRELAWFSMNWERCARVSFDRCVASLAAVEEGKLLFIAGVSGEPSINDDAAVICYLATNDFDQHLRAALRMTKHLFEVEAWKHTRFGRIEQYIPPPYKAGIRFLEWLGWTRGRIVSIGARQAVHMYFDRSEGLE